MKATVAPEAAVALQPIRSVKILTMGEQKNIIPMARAPTHARKEIKEAKDQKLLYKPTFVREKTVGQGRGFCQWKLI